MFYCSEDTSADIPKAYDQECVITWSARGWKVIQNDLRAFNLRQFITVTLEVGTKPRWLQETIQNLQWGKEEPTSDN